MKERAYIAEIERLGRPEDDAVDNFVVIVVPVGGDVNADVRAEQIADKHGYRIVQLHDGDNNYEIVRT
jgi:hypothetical protein